MVAEVDILPELAEAGGPRRSVKLFQIISNHFKKENTPFSYLIIYLPTHVTF